jgi:dinuclear metal center YbgI/SA1388 family protein
MKLDEVVQFLDEYLRINEWDDKSRNGLQVEGSSEVEKIAFAVDACMESFEGAQRVGADMLIVHHGLVWGGIEYVRGITARRLKFLLENGISLYAAHLPLDAHPEVGNNVQLLKIVGAEIDEPFGVYHGKTIGYAGIVDSSIEDIASMIEKTLNTEAKLLRFGEDEVRRVGVVSGKGVFAISQAIGKLDLFITGEAEHEAYHVAKEGGLNVIFAGHYATETVGVKALMEVVREKLGIEVEFVDVPTGL